MARKGYQINVRTPQAWDDNYWYPTFTELKEMLPSLKERECFIASMLAFVDMDRDSQLDYIRRAKTIDIEMEVGAAKKKKRK